MTRDPTEGLSVKAVASFHIERAKLSFTQATETLAYAQEELLRSAQAHARHKSQLDALLAEYHAAFGEEWTPPVRDKEPA